MGFFGGGGGGSSAWGSITGTLSAQSDLNSALGEKLTTTEATDAFNNIIVVGSDLPNLVGDLVDGTGYDNIAVGLEFYDTFGTFSGPYTPNPAHYALAALTEGAGNVAIGNSALMSVTEGQKNLALGHGSGRGVTMGNSNVLVGVNSAINITTGSNNTCVGSSSGGSGLTTGTQNTCIGRAATVAAAVSKSVAIGASAHVLDSGHCILGGTSAGNDTVVLGFSGATEPQDANVVNEQGFIYWDFTDGLASVKFKAKSADATVVTNELPLLSASGPGVTHSGSLAPGAFNLTFYPSLSMQIGDVFITASIWAEGTGVTGTFAGLTDLDYGRVAGVIGNFSPTLASVTTLTVASLTVVGGNFSPTAASLTSLALTSLTIVGGNLAPVAASLVTLTAGSLTRIEGNFSPTLASLTSLTLTSLTTVGGDFSPVVDALTSLNLAALATVGGNFSPEATSLTALTITSLAAVSNLLPNLPSVTAFSAPALTSAGNIELTVNSATSISLPLLATAEYLDVLHSSATTINLSSLASLNGELGIFSGNFGTLSLPSITTILGNFDVEDIAALMTVSINTGLLRISGWFICKNGALNQTSVNNILIRLAALNGTGGTTSYDNNTIDLTGGTNATPGASGLTAKATLLLRGNTVNTN